MYSFLIFLITFTIFLFEILAHIFFSVALTSDVFVLILIMILPWVIGHIRRDIEKYRLSTTGHIRSQVSRRKRLEFILECGYTYSLIGIYVSLIYIGVILLMAQANILSYAFFATISCLVINTIVSIWREALK